MEVVKVADFRSPLLVSNGQNILKRDFSPSFALKLMLKDADLIEKFGESLQSPIPALRVVEKISNRPLRLASGRKRLRHTLERLKKKLASKAKAQRAAPDDLKRDGTETTCGANKDSASRPSAHADCGRPVRCSDTERTEVCGCFFLRHSSLVFALLGTV